MQCEIFPVIRQTSEFVLFYLVESIGKRHVTVSVMMSISFSIGGDVHKLRGIPFGIEPAQKAPGKILTV